MMTNTYHAVIRSVPVPVTVFILASALVSGCAGSEEKAEVEPEDSAVISFTNIFQTVADEELDVEEEGKTVMADFNMDGLPDMAVVHDTSPTNSEVSIYIRKPDAGREMVDAMVSYYRVGTIREALGGRIVGIASARREKYTDLILLVNHPERGNEMIQYRNDGEGLKRVQ